MPDEDRHLEGVSPRPFAAVVPAAGRGERFGGQKLVTLVEGEPLLDRTLCCLIEAGAARVVVVVADAAPFSAVRRLHDPRVVVVVNPAPSRGMFSSIQAGLTAVGNAAQVLILPGDMPYVAVRTVARVAAVGAADNAAVAPTFEGRRGHPLSLPGSVLPYLRAADPHRGLSDLLTAAGIERMACQVTDAGVLHDVDVTTDLRP